MQFIFDFDREVEPIVEVIVGKTLEQAMMEVLEEEELKNLRQHQVRFQCSTYFLIPEDRL